MTDFIDRVADLAAAPITTAMDSADTSVVVADQAGDISRFPDPGSLGYDAYIWPRELGFPATVDAERVGLAEKVRVTARDIPSQTLTVVRGPSPLTVPASGYWIGAHVSSGTIEQIDDRIFDLVAGELVRDINVEMANLRADDAAFKGKPWFDVTHTDFGAVGDGVTDDGPAVEAALDAAVAAGGGVVYFPRGTYLLTTWTTTGYSPGGAAELILIGDGQDSLIQGNGTDDFMDVDAPMMVRDLDFSSFDQVFNLDGAVGTVSHFIAVDCKADSCAFFVDWTTPSALAKYNFIRVSRNRLTNMTGRSAIRFNDGAVGLGWDALEVADNFIDGGPASTMQTGIKIGYAVTSSVDATQTLWKNILVRGNVIRRVVGGAWHGRGIVVYGYHARVHDNVVEDVTGEAGTAFQNAGIQCGIVYGSVRGNVVRGLSGTAVLRNNGILLYGDRQEVVTPAVPRLHGVDCSGNTVTFDVDTTEGVGIGLLFGGSEVTIHDNHIQGADIGVYQPSSLFTLERVEVARNSILLAASGEGARFNGGGNEQNFSQNKIVGGAVGLRMQPNAGALTRVRLDGNQIDVTTDGIIFSGSQQVSAVSILGNQINDATDGIQFANVAFAPDDVFIAYNTFQGATNQINVSGLTPTNYRVILLQVQDSREQIRHEQDFRAGDGVWDGDHLILGTRRFWMDTEGALRVKASVPSSSRDGLHVGPNTGDAWDENHVIFGSWHIWADSSGSPRIKSTAPASSTDGDVFLSPTPATWLHASITSSIVITPTGGGPVVTNTITVSGAIPGDLSVGSHQNMHPRILLNTEVTATDTVTFTFVLTGITGSTLTAPSGSQRAAVLRPPS